MTSTDEARAPSKGSAWKIVLSVLAITGAGVFMLSRSIKDGAEYYKHVDEVMAAPDTLRSKRLQVHGNVVKDSIEVAKGTLSYRFKIESRSPRAPAVITATYSGIVPDTFKSGAEVVAKGALGPDNVLAVVPDGIMAKCPSKYKVGDEPNVSATAAAAAAPSAQKL